MCDTFIGVAKFSDGYRFSEFNQSYCYLSAFYADSEVHNNKWSALLSAKNSAKPGQVVKYVGEIGVDMTIIDAIFYCAK